MQCARCGYILAPFDQRCPKCEHLARTGQLVPQPGQLPPGAPPPPWANSTASRTNKTAIALLGAICLVLILLAATIYALSPHSRQKNASNPMVLQSSGGKTGFNLTNTPAVSSSQMNQRLTDASAKTGGEIEVSLAWNSLTDLDLQVADPNGELITAHHPNSATGGKQDVDANPTLVTMEGSARAGRGQNPGPKNVMELPEFLVDLSDKSGSGGFLPGMEGLSNLEGKAPSRITRSPIEHTYFGRAPKGIYTVYASCYSWREHNRNPLPFTVQVRSKGQVFHEVSGTIGPQNYIENNVSAIEVCRFEVK